MAIFFNTFDHDFTARNNVGHIKVKFYFCRYELFTLSENDHSDLKVADLINS